MSKLTSVFRGKSRGIGLIETMIAILLLGIVAVAFLSGISTAFKALLIADERSTAQSLALSQMESVKRQGYETAPSGGEATYLKIELDPSKYPDYSIKSVDRDGNIVDDIIGVPWDTAGNTTSTNDTGIQKVTIIIYHHEKNVLTLQDYKLDR